MRNYTILSEEDALEKFASNLKGNKTSMYFYKGIYSETFLSDFYWADPSKYIRPSKTVTKNGNAYNLLLNNLPAWQTLPLREKSIITSSNLKTAKSFSRSLKDGRLKSGKTFIVVPKYDSTIVIAPKSDIFYSFGHALTTFKLRGTKHSLVSFNLYLKEIANLFGFEDIYDSTWKLFCDFMASINNVKVSPDKLSMEAKGLLDVLINEDKGIIDFLNDSFSPKKNGFHLKIFNSSLKQKDFLNNEIWFDSPCLLVEKSWLDRFNYRLAK